MSFVMEREIKALEAALTGAGNSEEARKIVADFCRAHDGSHARRVLAELLRAAGKRCGTAFARRVYEYCLRVFELFGPELSVEREAALFTEIDARAGALVARVPAEAETLFAAERRAVREAVGAMRERGDFLNALRTERAWAIYNFSLYSRIYARHFGRLDCSPFPLAFASGSLLCLTRAAA